MKASLILTLLFSCASAFSAEQVTSFTEPSETVQIHFTVKSETETEVVISEPRVELSSEGYALYGGGGTGHALCKALGYQSGQETHVKTMIEGYFAPELILIDVQGQLSKIRNPLVLESAVCVK